ncbi:MAG: ATP-binding protein [Imperialibacter sp.]|uniref:sensor histidine kinase n=1 Tax=Imperialibacter sp. TaxID=2038411 RepID=UPI0032EBDB37
MMIPRCLVLTFILFAPYFSSGQSSLDSLLSDWELRKTTDPDTTTVNLLIDIATAYQYDNTDSALYYSSLAEEYSRELDFTRGLANSLTKKGICYYIRGVYDLSLDAHSSALVLHRQIGNGKGMALSLNGISLVYLGKDDLIRTIEYQRQSIWYSKNSTDSSLLANNYFNLGLAFDELRQFDSAYHYLDASIRVCNVYKNERIKLMVNNRLALTYFHEGRYRDAIEQYKKVLNADYYQSNWESTFAHAGMAEAYISLDEPVTAINHGRYALDYAERVGAMWDMERAYGVLAEAYAESGDFENAFETHKKYKQLSDSILSEAKEKEINLLMVKYHEAENQKLAQENKVQEKELRVTFLASIIFAVVLVFTIAVAYLLSRNSKIKSRLNVKLTEQNEDIARKKEQIEKQNERLEALNSTNSLILSIISHDMRSPIASMQSTIELMKGKFGTAFEDYAVFDELGKRVDNVATMLNNLLTWAGAQFSGIQTTIEEVNATAVVQDLVAVYGFQAAEKNISLVHQPQANIFLRADVSQLKIIVQNLLSNAIKFTREGGEVRIDYSQNSSMTSIHIVDNGVGMTREKLGAIQNKVSKRLSDLGTSNEPGTGLGILLVKQFIASNEGSMEIKSEAGKGTEFIISFKKV